MKTTTQEAWDELVTDVRAQASQWQGVPMNLVLDELSPLIRMGQTPPISMDLVLRGRTFNVDLFELRRRGGRPTLGLEARDEKDPKVRLQFEGAPYRHTDAKGRRGQTRSVYLTDEQWRGLQELGPPPASDDDARQGSTPDAWARAHVRRAVDAWLERFQQ